MSLILPLSPKPAPFQSSSVKYVPVLLRLQLDWIAIGQKDQLEQASCPRHRKPTIIGCQWPSIQASSFCTTRRGVGCLCLFLCFFSSLGKCPGFLADNWWWSSSFLLSDQTQGWVPTALEIMFWERGVSSKIWWVISDWWWLNTWCGDVPVCRYPTPRLFLTFCALYFYHILQADGSQHLDYYVPPC